MEWTETHDYLELVMKRELETMRRLLENMHLEEQFLMQKQKKHWSAMMQERELLMQQLKAIRQDKGSTTQKLRLLFRMVEASLQELLPPDHGSSFEILSLQDQMITLTDRISLQTSRNEMLKSLVQAHIKEVPKKKIAVATLPLEEYKEKGE
jgi:hypothetical protein